jgi:hypothetical protein
MQAFKGALPPSLARVQFPAMLTFRRLEYPKSANVVIGQACRSKPLAARPFHSLHATWQNRCQRPTHGILVPVLLNMLDGRFATRYSAVTREGSQRLSGERPYLLLGRTSHHRDINVNTSRTGCLLRQTSVCKAFSASRTTRQSLVFGRKWPRYRIRVKMRIGPINITAAGVPWIQSMQPRLTSLIKRTIAHVPETRSGLSRGKQRFIQMTTSIKAKVCPRNPLIKVNRHWYAAGSAFRLCKPMVAKSSA